MQIRSLTPDDIPAAAALLRRAAEEFILHESAPADGARFLAEQGEEGMRRFLAQGYVYHVAEIRNSGMQCEQFTTEARPLHDCSTCADRATPSRSIDDVKQEQAYAAMSSGKAAAGNSAADTCGWVGKPAY